MSTKIQAAIIDDEKLARDIIKTYLKKRDDIELMAECSNGFEGIKTVNTEKPDIIFLDIQMPKLNGFEMLELLEHSPKIIFTTAFDQYALKAFEVNAVDYLLKPFSEERFNEALGKAIQQTGQKGELPEEIKKLRSQLEDDIEFIDRVIVKNNQKIIIIPIEKVNYIEAQDDYVMIHSSEGKFLKQKTMKYFENHLDPKDYIRIHRSFIVRIDQIKEVELFEKDSYRVALKDDTKLSVSRSGYTRLKEIFD